MKPIIGWNINKPSIINSSWNQGIMIDLSLSATEAETAKQKHSHSKSAAQRERETTTMWKPRLRSRCWFSGEFKIEHKKGFLIKSMPPILVCPHKLHNFPAHTRKFPRDHRHTLPHKSLVLENELVAERIEEKRLKWKLENRHFKP